jgi:site-specific recombinase XerD
VWNIKHLTVLTICYAAGLRVSEAVCLKVTDIDNKRMVIRIEQGKGRIEPSFHTSTLRRGQGICALSSSKN